MPMRHAGRVVITVLCLAAPAGAQVSIEHPAVGCVAVDKFPRFEARIEPAGSVARARLHFRPEGWPHWYSVPMRREGTAFFGVLPKPEKKLQRFDYYISATDAGLREGRTPERTPVVVSGPGGCQRDKVLAVALKKAAQVMVNVPEGIANLPLVPAGFSTDGVIAGAASAAGGTPAASGAGSAGSGSAAGAVAAGGGVSATVLVVGALAVVGGGAAIASKAGGGGGGGGGSTTTQPAGSANTTVPAAPPTTTPGQGRTLYDVNFSPNIDVSACAGRSLTWCCHNVAVDANGDFNETWSFNEPNTVRISGRLDATRFGATFACVSGGPSTQLNATGSGGTYRGNFSFAGSSGSLTVTRQGAAATSRRANGR